MAPLRGRLQGTRGETTRLGHRQIEATLATWDGEVKVVLFKNGDYLVYAGEVNGSMGREPIARGNVSDSLVASHEMSVREGYEVRECGCDAGRVYVGPRDGRHALTAKAPASGRFFCTRGGPDEKSVGELYEPR